MSRHLLYKHEPKYVRDTLRGAANKAAHILEQEKELVAILQEIDFHRFYVRLGYKSLRTYCTHGLKFTRIQAQRIVTLVRRTSTTSDIEHEERGTTRATSATYDGAPPTTHIDGTSPNNPDKSPDNYADLGPQFLNTLL